MKTKRRKKRKPSAAVVRQQRIEKQLANIRKGIERVFDAIFTDETHDALVTIDKKLNRLLGGSEHDQTIRNRPDRGVAAGE